MRVRYSRRALSQVASVYEYLSERSPAGAKRVSESLKMTVARLEELPRLGKTTDEGGVYLIVEPEYLYRVFYRLDRDEVFVIASCTDDRASWTCPGLVER